MCGAQVWCWFPKIGVVYYPQNGWVKISWKTLLNFGWFGGKHPYFWKHPFGPTETDPLIGPCPPRRRGCIAEIFALPRWIYRLEQQSDWREKPQRFFSKWKNLLAHHHPLIRPGLSTTIIPQIRPYCFNQLHMQFLHTTIESNHFTWVADVMLRMPGFTCPFTSVLWRQHWSSFHSESKSNYWRCKRINRIRRIW